MNPPLLTALLLALFSPLLLALAFPLFDPFLVGDIAPECWVG